MINSVEHAGVAIPLALLVLTLLVLGGLSYVRTICDTWTHSPEW